MPIEVPAEPKKYTTVYDNFKGVDFTDDPSNVFKRRSPGGVNMLPDLDGRPYKRKGWHIDVPYTAFIDANYDYPDNYADEPLNALSNDDEEESTEAILIAEFTPRRIHHFTLGGADYMVFFNSMGVFYCYKTEGGEVSDVKKCFLATGTGDATETWNFPPAELVSSLDGETYTTFDADPGRSFFFEGAGEAGFYTFVGANLYKFDGEYYREVDPYVPTVLIACDRYGAGTDYENVNLLTRERRVQFQGGDLVSGGTETQRTLIIPSGIKNASDVVVEMMTTSGEWAAVGNSYPYTIPLGTDGKPKGWILFTNAVPPIVIRGEDNIRVTYTPSGGIVIPHYDTQTHQTTDSEEHQGTRLATATGTAYKVVTVTRYEYDVSYTGTSSPNWGYPSSIETTTDTTYEAARLNISGATGTVTSSQISPSGGTVNYGSYSSQITYTPPDSAFPSSGSTSTSVRYINCTNGWHGSSVPGTYYSDAEFMAKWRSLGYINPLYATRVTTITTRYPVSVAASYTQYYTYYTTTTTTTTTTTETYEAVVPEGEASTMDATAFTRCRKAGVYGSGIINQVFMCASESQDYSSRMWYSGVSKPNYWPDLNYVEVGANDTAIMGLLKCGEYLGVVKAGNTLDSSIYLAYPTSFDDNTTYAVRQSIAGVGAISNGAFNILSEEPLFLSSQGILGVEIGEENRLRRRSWFLDGKLCKENNLDEAISYVFDDKYYLCVNNRCYVLDGSQKSSWMNEKTNLQYEGYFLDNIPAQCFAHMGDDLYFTDFKGNLCRFKKDGDAFPYLDSYSTGNADYTSSAAPQTSEGVTTFALSALTPTTAPDVDKTIVYNGAFYTITSVGATAVTVVQGVPIKARWDTVADDDGAVHFFKNLQKKGCLVSLLPGYDTSVRISLKADEKEPIQLQEVYATDNSLPHEFYTKKKVKKYKRLQIICENDGWNDGFGIDQIIKTYTLGNYSKNRGGA